MLYFQEIYGWGLCPIRYTRIPQSTSHIGDLFQIPSRWLQTPAESALSAKLSGWWALRPSCVTKVIYRIIQKTPLVIDIIKDKQILSSSEQKKWSLIAPAPALQNNVGPEKLRLQLWKKMRQKASALIWIFN